MTLFDTSIDRFVNSLLIFSVGSSFSGVLDYFYSVLTPPRLHYPLNYRECRNSRFTSPKAGILIDIFVYNLSGFLIYYIRFLCNSRKTLLKTLLACKDSILLLDVLTGVAIHPNELLAERRALSYHGE